MRTALSLLEQAQASQPERPDDALIRRIAADIIDDLGVLEPPVDVGMVASYLDISAVVADRTLTVAGCLVCASGRSEIRVRAGDSLGRRRFTVCHECGHTFFPGFRRVPQYRCVPRASAPAAHDLESLCDVAASELLLPEALFRRALDEVPLSFEGVEYLAELFDASLAATMYRAAAFWVEPVAVLSFEICQKPSELSTSAPRRLRLQSAKTFGGWPYFRPHKSVNDGDVFDRASQGEVVSEEATVNGICTSPVEAEVHARHMPYQDDAGDVRQRVLAMLRRTS